ncbi:hypothetical protein D3C81_1733020 [compost metagenome]
MLESFYPCFGIEIRFRVVIPIELPAVLHQQGGIHRIRRQCRPLVRRLGYDRQTEGHMVFVQHGQQVRDIVPGFRNFESKLGQHILAVKQHVERLRFRQRIYPAAIFIRYDRAFPEAGGHFVVTA